jgi:hypothetical protein
LLAIAHTFLWHLTLSITGVGHFCQCPVHRFDTH